MPAHASLSSVGSRTPPGLLAFHESAWAREIVQAGRDVLPALAAALGILVVGYLVALVAAGLTRRALHRTNLDDRLMNRLGRETEQGVTERTGGKAVFWFIMIFVFLAAFQVLGLSVVGQPLSEFLNTVTAYLPRLLGAAALGVLAWGVATVLKRGSRAAMQASGFDERVGRSAGEERVALSESLSTGIYWLVILLFLPAILGALQLGTLVEPVNVLLNEFMAFVPNLVGAAALLVVGWFVASVVRNAAAGFLSAAGLDSLGERWGIQESMGEQTPSGLVGLFLYVAILIPVVVGALGVLGIDAITQPAQNALDETVGAIPNVAAAAGIVLIAYLVARVVAGVVTGLTAGVGVDRLWGALGVTEPERVPAVSRMLGWAAGAFILGLASIEAAAVLGFDLVAVLFTDLVVFAGRVALGLVILGAGLWLGRVANEAVRATRAANARTLATIAQVAIVTLAGGMALQQIGVANQLVLLTFGLVLGAAAVAGALAFGLGGRSVAEDELRNWRSRARGGRPGETTESSASSSGPGAVAGGED